MTPPSLQGLWDHGGTTFMGDRILHDRYIYWRLLSTDPAAAKDVVLAEKPTISEETDLLEPGLLDELICHISTLASVYHKPPSAFVEGKVPVRRITLQPRAEP